MRENHGEESGRRTPPGNVSREAGEEKRPVQSLKAKRILLFAVAALLIVISVNSFFAQAISINRSLPGDSCCFGCPAAPGAEALSRTGLDYYRIRFGEEKAEGVEARIEDYGCHQEILIYREGELLHRLVYSNGKIYEQGYDDGAGGCCR